MGRALRMRDLPLTLLHEMSHSVINTKDAVYDFDG